MARMKFICDAERCIECNGCVTACKAEHEVPWGVNRRRVVTLNDGVPGEKSISVACMHCSDAPCMAVCPVDCFYRTDEGVVLHDKDVCIGCGYCSLRLPVRRAAVPDATAPSACAARWTSAPSAPAAPRPTAREAEFEKYGRNRLAEGKLPACAEMCSTKALLGGDGDVVADIFRTRVLARGKGSEVWGWGTAYGKPSSGAGTAPQQPKRGQRNDERARCRSLLCVAALARGLRREAADHQRRRRRSPTPRPGKAPRTATWRPAGRQATRPAGSSSCAARTQARTNTSRIEQLSRAIGIELKDPACNARSAMRC